MFMDYLANGVDPVSNAAADTNTLQSEQVIACFPYISDVLARNIYAAGNSTKTQKCRLLYYRETVCGSECVFLPYLFRCDTAAVYGQKLHNRVRLGMAVTQ